MIDICNITLLYLFMFIVVLYRNNIYLYNQYIIINEIYSKHTTEELAVKS